MRKATFLQLPTHKFYSRIIQAAFVFITTLLTFTSSAYARKPRGAVAQSGDVLITGGVAGKGGVTNAAEFYRPSAGRFFKTGTMVDARAGHQSFEIGVTPETSKPIMFVIGGFRGAAHAAGPSYALNGSPIASIETYNLNNGQFAKYTVGLSVARLLFAAVPFPGDFAVTQIDGHVLIVGGLSRSGPTDLGEAVDPTNVQDLTGNLNVPRALCTATLLNNGLVLVTGGVDGSGNPTDTAELFDPVDFTYSLLGSTMTTPRAGHTATLLGDGTVLIAGGASSSGGSLAALDSAEIYDPGSESFSSVGTAMNSKRVGHTATPLSNGTVLLAGGFNGSATLAISGGSVSWSATSGTVLDNAEIYNPGSQSFACVGGASGGSCASSMTPAVFPTATALSNGAVLIAGGFGGKKWRPQKTAQLFTGGQFQNTGNMKTARALHAAAVVQ